MASNSGSTTLQTGWTLSVSFNETGTNTTNNTSSINVSATIGRTNSAYKFNYTNAGTLAVYWHDNNRNTDVLVASATISEVGYNVASRSVSGSITATHKADGTLSGYAKAVWTKNVSSGYIPASGNVSTPNTVLTKIARQVNIASVNGSITDENFSPTVTWTNNGNRVDLKLEIPGNSSWKRWNNLQGSDRYSPTLTQAEINQLVASIPNAKSLSMRFTIVTVINGTDSFWSYIDKPFTIVNANPEFSDFSYQDTNAATTAITEDDQVLISGYSTLQATISAAQQATAKKNATMKLYTFAINGVSQDENYTGSAITKNLGTVTLPINSATTTKALVVTALDSRSNATSVQKAITIVQYAKPTVAATATRQNGFEANTTITISGTFSPIAVNGTPKNTVATSGGVQYRYKSTSTTTWGSWTNATGVTVDTTTGKVTVPNFVISLDSQQSYNVEIRITDRLFTTTGAITVNVGQPAFYIGADGRVSVGAMPTRAMPSGDKGMLEVQGQYFGRQGLYGSNVAVATDTPQGWFNTLGNGKTIIIYTQTGRFAGQPSQYGYLETILNGTEACQIWHQQSNGETYIRSGNQTGWSSGFRRIQNSTTYGFFAAKCVKQVSSTGASSALGLTSIGGDPAGATMAEIANGRIRIKTPCLAILSGTCYVSGTGAPQVWISAAKYNTAGTSFTTYQRIWTPPNATGGMTLVVPATPLNCETGESLTLIGGSGGGYKLATNEDNMYDTVRVTLFQR